MLPSPSVLIGTQVLDLGERIAAWVRQLGYVVRVTQDGVEAVEVLRRGSFAASFLDSQLGGAGGESIWRVVRPILGRRLILMASERSNEFWFEALRSGVGTVLPLPPAERMVRAALAAVGAP
jgi:DNA-binding response OmpR family regulator